VKSIGLSQDSVGTIGPDVYGVAVRIKPSLGEYRISNLYFSP
jgi:hypothetical protein